MMKNSGIICINKPANITSFSVCNRLSKMLHYKVGHCGTLDPNATGLLVCIINKTKFLPYIDTDTKTYVASCKLFIKTDTGDIWGNIIEKRKFVNFSNTEIQTVINDTLNINILPIPIVSAKKVNGQKLLDYHLKKQEIATQYQDVSIYNVKLISFIHDTIKFEITVSKGTYIRSICEWIGERLNTIATMESLERIKIGNFLLSNAIALDQININNYQDNMLDFNDYLIDLPKVEYSDLNHIIYGKPIELQINSQKVFITNYNQVVAVYKKSNDGLFIMERGLF